MKRGLRFSMAAAVICFAACVALTGCGEKMPYEGLNLDDYIQVGEYKGLKVEDYSTKVSDAEVKERIDAALKQAGTQSDLKKGDEIKKGDTVNIDYSGKLDGKAFDGGTAQGYDLEIGSKSFIDGFEDGLIGKKIGEKVSLDLTFPKNYNSEELAGKDVVFDVTINSGKRTDKPKYDDAFVKKNTSYKTTAEYEESLKKSIAEEKETSGKNTQKGELWSQVMDNTEMKDYPQDQLTKYQDVFSKQIDAAVEQSGMDRSQVLAQYGASDEAGLKQVLKESAETLIKQEMAIEYIAQKEGLTYTKDEKEAKIAEVEGMGYDDEKVQEQTGRTMDEYVHINLLYEKVMDRILENAKITKAKS